MSSGSPKPMAALTSRYIWMAALLGTQVANVVGSLYLKLAMVTPTPPHPVIFALYREVLTGAALLAVATTVHRVVPRRRDLLRIAGLGLCLFLNQLLFILGLFLAGVTLASCMQPTIPIFTSVLSMICGQEQPSTRRVASSALASTGAMLMVYGRSGTSPPPPAPAGPTPADPDAAQLSGARRLHLSAADRHTLSLRAHTHASGHTIRDRGAAAVGAVRQLMVDSEGGGLGVGGLADLADGVDAAAGVATPSGAATSAPLLGALSLAGNCAAMAGYFVIARSISGAYPPLALTAWAYVAAASCMTVVAVLCVPWSEFVLPSSALGPLAYWVLVTSMGGYSILTAATRALPATQVSAFICAQPIAGTLLGWAVLGERVSAWDCGAALIVAGLLLVIQDDRVAPRMVSMRAGSIAPLSRGLSREDSGEFAGLWMPNSAPRASRR